MRPSARHLLIVISVFFLMVHQALPHNHVSGKAEFSFNRSAQGFSFSQAFFRAISSNLGEDHLEHLQRMEPDVDLREIPLSSMNFNPPIVVLSIGSSSQILFLIISDLFPALTNYKPDLSLRAPPVS